MKISEVVSQEFPDAAPEMREKIAGLIEIGYRAGLAKREKSVLANVGAVLVKYLKQPSTYAGGGLLAILAARYLPGVNLQTIAEIGGAIAAVAAVVLDESKL